MNSKDIPISNKWVLKPVIFTLIKSIAFALFLTVVILLIQYSSGETNYDKKLNIGLFIIYATIVLGGMLIGLIQYIVRTLQKRNFSFNFQEDFIVFHQGIISKQEKNLPYSVIQNINTTQDIMDRVLGIYSLIIQNAASAGGVFFETNQPNQIGFYSNSVIIPGLSKHDTEILRSMLFEKIQTKKPSNPNSGL